MKERDRPDSIWLICPICTRTPHQIVPAHRTISGLWVYRATEGYILQSLHKMVHDTATSLSLPKSPGPTCQCQHLHLFLWTMRIDPTTKTPTASMYCARENPPEISSLSTDRNRAAARLPVMVKEPRSIKKKQRGILFRILSRVAVLDLAVTP